MYPPPVRSWLFLVRAAPGRCLLVAVCLFLGRANNQKPTATNCELLFTSETDRQSQTLLPVVLHSYTLGYCCCMYDCRMHVYVLCCAVKGIQAGNNVVYDTEDSVVPPRMLLCSLRPVRSYGGPSNPRMRRLN